MTGPSIQDSSISGRGVFAVFPIASGQKLFRFSGPLLTPRDIKLKDDEIKDSDDRYIQIGPALYMGPSGQMDDLVNHSCSPNSGLRWFGHDLWLISIWPINPGQEIVWDYSTSIGPDDPWTMPCHCGSAVCRNTIGPFHLLSNNLKNFYRSLAVDLVNRWT